MLAKLEERIELISISSVLSTTLLVLFTGTAWTWFIAAYLSAFAYNSCWAHHAFAVEPLAVNLSEAADFVVNIAHTIRCVCCFEFNDSFVVVFCSLFCTENLEAMPGTLVAPVFSSLAVDFCNLVTFFAAVDDEVDFMLYIRSIAGSHEGFCSRGLCCSLDDWFAAV